MTSKTELRLGGTPDDEAYLNLGRAIARQCTPGFQQAVLDADLSEEEALRLKCRIANGSEFELQLSDEARQQIRQAIGVIRERMAEQDGARFKRATTTLVAGGGFSMDVEY